MAYGSSQARDQIRAAAADLHHSHGNTRSLTHWAKPGMVPKSSWILVRFITAESQQELCWLVFIHFPTKELNHLISRYLIDICEWSHQNQLTKVCMGYSKFHMSNRGYFFFFFFAVPMACWSSRPGIEPLPLQGLKPLWWQCLIFNPLSHRGTSNIHF